MQINNYNLPEIHMIGGNSDTWIFELFTEGGNPFDGTGVEANLSIIDYSGVNSDSPVVSKTVSAIQDNDNNNTVKFDLLPSDTVNLCGRYVYQVALRYGAEEASIPNQGILYINRNINPSFITSEEE